MARLFGTLVKQAIMVLMTISSLYPLYFLLITSLKTGKEYTANSTGFPHSITFQNFSDALTKVHLGVWFSNTIVLTVVSVFLTTLISALAAYAIAWGKFIGRQTLLKLCIALMVVPPVILIIPMFFVMVKVQLINTLTSAIIFYTGLMIPFSVYLLTSFFREIPSELFQAAQIDGCSRFGAFWRIVIPLAAPAFVTLVIVNSLWVWNELLIALVFLQDESKRTIMAGISMFQGRYNTNQPLIMASSFLSLLPILLLYLFGQRFFIRGLTAGIGK
ncbi:carbohydrate ABC transporter permease [Ferviditalea candida]|uniref:Carbohydrate ABC transporter permease n=1 Tax=Ferviditalea candida TaxID=3108399 RepID=A0ABU5ZFD1_9BACL|nr:carbohydrate ABC transporter permease [Paenibacillaceae bacterium T2]